MLILTMCVHVFASINNLSLKQREFIIKFKILWAFSDISVLCFRLLLSYRSISGIIFEMRNQYVCVYFNLAANSRSDCREIIPRQLPEDLEIYATKKRKNLNRKIIKPSRTATKKNISRFFFFCLMPRL